ncbi:MAG: RNA-binding S4 domain-containing protein [Oscillospiraceae bacterium]|nr:RNA-binding S4 domain-containing protein [Oscillospiraceae bacterium]
MKKQSITEVFIKPPFIKLEQFLKLSGSVSTGGEAKNLIQDGKVTVNGEVCLMRGKKLFGGEKIRVDLTGDIHDYADLVCVVNGS